MVSTLHDPENRLEELVDEYVGAIEKAFDLSYVVATPSTHQKIVGALDKIGFEVSRGQETIVGAYKKALESALSKNARKIFYCDFDRILHWAMKYPDELVNLIGSYRGYDFVLIGRTDRAFMTHPETQTSTENIANIISSRILGFKETRDIISACWRLTPRLVRELLRLPESNRYGFYCQWPIEAWRKAEKPYYVEVEGLEWETPDRYSKEIKCKGYDAWLKDFQTPGEWRKRVQILTDSIESINKFTSAQG